MSKEQEYCTPSRCRCRAGPPRFLVSALGAPVLTSNLKHAKNFDSATSTFHIALRWLGAIHTCRVRTEAQGLLMLFRKDFRVLALEGWVLHISILMLRWGVQAHGNATARKSQLVWELLSMQA